ncbi:M48 family metallopeptidase [Janibacter sp. YIM B02568]|uniref:SprT-like domain-containing protein n=1 Tax=Janibacter endophyticus TaxID=2806261 RepID=UPI00194DE30A|nr:SprT-like domain-containing protein [Janibacter endophyticus]MBM6545717.1 M48 family metallopeptidase [Janibacter endophyticus]
MEGFSDVEIRRSRRRRKTVSAHREGDRLVLLMPAGLSARLEERYVKELGEKVLAREQRRRPSDSDLLERAARLSDRYLEGRAVPSNVRWVTNQSSRWGSCTTSGRTIRLSHRLRGMPDYVIDYVLLHELVHLLVPGHGPDFHALLDRYPRVERASGYLEGWSGRDGSGGVGDDEAVDGDGDETGGGVSPVG